MHASKLLPNAAVICGYARSKKTDESFRKGIRGYLKGNAAEVDRFLARCYYRVGQYHVAEHLGNALRSLRDIPGIPQRERENRMFYMAIPPSRFHAVGKIVKEAGMSATGWNRIVVEKPFGKDTESCRELSEGLKQLFREDQLYRIDHYLGKPGVKAIANLVQNNPLISGILSGDRVESVLINWEEDIGTEGRGGYFDQFGIIRDIAQNHLMQILTLFAMETPDVKEGGEAWRNAKVEVLKKISPIRTRDTVVGQYQGYLEDKGVPPDSKTPTFALMKLRIDTPRWRSTPFFLRCGKALKDRLCDVVIKLRPSPSSRPIASNLIRIRVQPNPALAIRLIADDGKERWVETPVSRGATIGGAYATLLWEVIRGERGSFVRYDELQLAWGIFTPLLHALEKCPDVVQYRRGSSGPDTALQVLRSCLGIERLNAGVPRSKL
uniref:glucose-6-phosphate dehydrogenase (NADP(+)) n=1 Tax=Lotharella oceanica TaxID=641309 RepID=A0A7S2XD65_9EUKA